MTKDLLDHADVSERFIPQAVHLTCLMWDANGELSKEDMVVIQLLGTGVSARKCHCPDTTDSVCT
jgi:hypothetical protein